jgi:hypothetical protein
VASFLAGLVFVGVAVAHLLGGLDSIGVLLRWVWPALLIVLGTGLLVAGSVRRRTAADD